VVEVYGNGALALMDSPLRHSPRGWRSAARRCFSTPRTPGPCWRRWPPGPSLRTLHRPANLEDLFLKLTGRQIREDG
jgi:lipooligosaccharide transport system ATP-binding protein